MNCNECVSLSEQLALHSLDSAASGISPQQLVASLPADSGIPPH